MGILYCWHGKQITIPMRIEQNLIGPIAEPMNF